MYRLVKLLAFACCVVTAAAVCSLSKYNEGPKDWLRCSSSSIDEAKTYFNKNLITISILQSVIPEIPNFAFALNATTVENLNLHNCGINRIGNEAFRGLMSLKKLSLAYNNITKLNSSWFYDLSVLEQLDISFNKISELDSKIYFQLNRLQRLDINDNLLKEIPTQNMENMRNLKTIRIQENPLTYASRAKVTFWLKNHRVNYATSDDNFIWFDKTLWDCLVDIEDNQNLDKKMNICVISQIFNQMTTVLAAGNSTAECVPFRKSLTHCLQSQNIKTNGEMLLNLLALIQNVAKIKFH